MTNITPPAAKRRPFVLWITTPERLRPPRALLTAGSEREVREWFRKRPELSQLRDVPLVRYLDVPARGAVRWAELSPKLAPAFPAWIQGPELSSWIPPQLEDLTQVMNAWVAHAAAVVDRLPAPTWEIVASSTGGLLALGSALSCGAGVALAPTPPPAHLFTACNAHGVDLAIRESDVPHVERKAGSREKRIQVLM